MPELSERISFTLDQELGGTDGSEPPDTVQVLPSGEVNPKGKTSFLVDEEARRLILDAFEKGATDLVVDYEHQSLSGSEAPAAGWIKYIEDRGGDGVWAMIQWTGRAREYLKKREYRYLSPVVLIRKKDGRAVELLGAALTNLPAIEGMVPVVNTSRPLPTDDACVSAADFRGMFLGVLRLMGLPEDAGVEDVRTRVLALSKPEGFVPKSEYVALKEELRAREAEGMIREALAVGRITPALTEWARAYALEDPEGFREFLGKACPVVPLGMMDDAKDSRSPAVDGAQRSVNSLIGVADDVFVRFCHPVL